MKAPIYERQVQKVLAAIASGITKKDLANMLGYTNIKSLDNYMRRKNFSWDGRKGVYYPTAEKQTAPISPQHPGKCAQILTKFAEGSDPKKIAKENGFNCHLELAGYMKKQGYSWDSKARNYTLGCISEETVRLLNEKIVESERKRDSDLGELLTFLPLLKILRQKEQKLMELLEKGG
ncbi:hypothetical protein [Dethiobacter alkaliphilus]|uniref:hypothetical protein n=1 Tax=Dethiobacter alkaliphilus TaxID=427926 RepID=UPI0022279978|nr:hypothetical protein [Dethiobacter alkaliphilus]MCW3490302.1 hypothetical protein [Dethiobacter alkaliphilus]